jgi:hypothetical protein
MKKGTVFFTGAAMVIAAVLIVASCASTAGGASGSSGVNLTGTIWGVNMGLAGHRYFRLDAGGTVQWADDMGYNALVSGKDDSWMDVLYSTRSTWRLRGNAFTMTSADNRLKWSGTFNMDDATITGTYKAQGGDGIPFTLNIAGDIFEKIDLGDSLYLVKNKFNNKGNALEYRLSAVQLNNLISPQAYLNELHSISKAVYTKVQDEYDYVFFILDKAEQETVGKLGFYANYHHIQQKTQGIGQTSEDGSSLWGSQGKLTSAVYFPTFDGVSRGPSLHEFLHQWANHAIPTFNQNGAPMDGHWGISNAGGQLGGFNTVQTVSTQGGVTKYHAGMVPSGMVQNLSALPGGMSDFGLEANHGNSVPYSDIELYLMGMVSAQNLRDKNFRLDVYTGCSIDDEASWGEGYFNATGIKSYTIDDIIALNGERVPGAADSQKTFKVLIVFLTDENAKSPRTGAAVQGVQWFAGRMEQIDPIIGGRYNFTTATNGIGHIQLDDISKNLK